MQSSPTSTNLQNQSPFLAEENTKRQGIWIPGVHAPWTAEYAGAGVSRGSIAMSMGTGQIFQRDRAAENQPCCGICSLDSAILFYTNVWRCEEKERIDLQTVIYRPFSHNVRRALHVGYDLIKVPVASILDDYDFADVVVIVSVIPRLVCHYVRAGCDAE